MPAVGVAQRDDLGAGVGRGAQHLQGVGAVGEVAVEEVLGVEEHPPPLAAQEGDGVAHHREVLRAGRAQGGLDVAQVALGHERHDRGARVAAAPAPGGPATADVPARRVAPKAASVAWRSESSCRARAKNSVSLGLAPGQPPSMKPDPEVVQVRGDGQLVGDREVEALLLRAVAQGGVVDVQLAHRRSRLGRIASVPVHGAGCPGPPRGWARGTPCPVRNFLASSRPAARCRTERGVLRQQKNPPGSGGSRGGGCPSR